MHRALAFLPGDGIGPELMEMCLPVLERGAEIGGHSYDSFPGLVGWAAYDQHDDVMPPETWHILEKTDAVLFGAVGLPDRDPQLPPALRPERRALLPIRQHFGLGCNIRPIRVPPFLSQLSPLKNERIGNGIDLVFFRELIGGDYFGDRKVGGDGQWAEDVCRYERWQIESIAEAAFKMAEEDGTRVTSIDKANVLGATGTFWRQVVQEVHDKKYPKVPLEHVFVDAFNLYLFTRPSSFKVVLTSNAHGDILSDGAAGLAGSMGLLPSASLNTQTGFAMYEPAGGSAPDIAGKGVANPVAMLLSIALLFRYTFRDTATSDKIKNAVYETLQDGYCTPDIALIGTGLQYSTEQVVSEVLLRLAD